MSARVFHAFGNNFGFALIALWSLAAAILVAPQAGYADGFGFMTPSKNINCNGHVSGGGGIDCTIVSRGGPTALPKPTSCKGIWGHSFSLDGNGRATMTCEKSVHAVDFYPEAPYGQSADFGSITCTSERTGLTCRNKKGHGFFLSRKKQTVF